MGAVDALEGEGKAGMAADIFQQAVGNQVRALNPPSNLEAVNQVMPHAQLPP